MKGLDYPSERYVRLYTRDTVSWSALPWEAQALYPQILRKVDRAGVLDLGDEMLSEALSAILPRWPQETLERASEALIDKGFVGRNKEENWLFIPGFEEAERAKMTSAQRSREHRAKRAATEKAQRSVADRDATSQNGTRGDAAGRGGTRRDSVPSLPMPPEVLHTEQDAVFSHYLECKLRWYQILGKTTPRKTNLTASGKTAIRSALKSGHAVEDIKEALDHVQNDAWLMGRHERCKSPQLSLDTLLLIRTNGQKPLDRVAKLRDKTEPDQEMRGPIGIYEQALERAQLKLVK